MTELLGIARALHGMDVAPGPDTARTASAARAALGDPGYDAAYGRGAALGPERAFTVLVGRIAGQ